jgi:hypothetical protein
MYVLSYDSINQNARVNASTAIGNIVKQSLNISALVNKMLRIKGCIGILVALLVDDQFAIRNNVAIILKHIATVTRTHASIRATPCISYLFFLFAESNIHTQVTAVYMLAILALNKDNHTQLYEAGIMARLQLLLTVDQDSPDALSIAEVKNPGKRENLLKHKEAQEFIICHGLTIIVNLSRYNKKYFTPEYCLALQPHLQRIRLYENAPMRVAKGAENALRLLGCSVVSPAPASSGAEVQKRGP